MRNLINRIKYYINKLQLDSMHHSKLENAAKKIYRSEEYKTEIGSKSR